MAEYITISDFAKRVGVTPQAVYPRLTGRLAKYAIKTEEDDWRISTDALREYKTAESEQTIDKPLEQEVDKPFQGGSQEVIKALQESYQGLVKILQGQLKDRDATIAAKDAMIVELIAENSRLANRVLDVVQDGQRIKAVSQLSPTAAAPPAAVDFAAAAPAQAQDVQPESSTDGRKYKWWEKKKKQK